MGTAGWTLRHVVRHPERGHGEPPGGQLLVARVDRALALVVPPEGVQGEGEEHVLLARVGQVPVVPGLVPPQQREQVANVPSLLRPVSTLLALPPGSELHHPNREVGLHPRPAAPLLPVLPHQGRQQAQVVLGVPGGRAGEKGVRGLTMRIRSPFTLVPNHSPDWHPLQRGHHGVVEEAVAVVVVLVVHVVRDSALGQRGRARPRVYPGPGVGRGDDPQRSVAQVVRQVTGGERRLTSVIRSATRLHSLKAVMSLSIDIFS